MQIDLLKLGDGVSRFDGADPAEIFDLENDVSFRAGGALKYSVDAEQVDGQIIVRGTLSAVMRCCCVRCCCWFDEEVEVNNFLCALEVGEEDEVVDLTAEMREAIILALSDYPLCRDTCKGLCPHCGADRNEKMCDCRPPAIECWQGLDGIKV